MSDTTISLPFCYLPNTRIQVIDLENCQRSLFQIKELERVSKLPNFAYFVICQGSKEEGGQMVVSPRHRGAFSICWYDKDGQFWAGRIGSRKMLLDWHKAGGPGKPEPLHSQVYLCRTTN